MLHLAIHVLPFPISDMKLFLVGAFIEKIKTEEMENVVRDTDLFMV